MVDINIFEMKKDKNKLVIELPDDFQHLELLILGIGQVFDALAMDIFDDDMDFISTDGIMSELEYEILRDLYRRSSTS